MADAMLTFRQEVMKQHLASEARHQKRERYLKRALEEKRIGNHKKASDLLWYAKTQI